MTSVLLSAEEVEEQMNTLSAEERATLVADFNRFATNVEEQHVVYALKFRGGASGIEHEYRLGLHGAITDSHARCGVSSHERVA